MTKLRASLTNSAFFKIFEAKAEISAFIAAYLKLKLGFITIWNWEKTFVDVTTAFVGKREAGIGAACAARTSDIGYSIGKHIDPERRSFSGQSG